MLIYATDTDLMLWLSDLPANKDALLRKASGLVRKATRAARYDVDSAGKPADPEILQAFTDATCAQVAYWANNDIDPATAGTQQVVASKSMGDRNVSYVNAQGAADLLAHSGDRLCSEAFDILTDAGLTSGQPVC